MTGREGASLQGYLDLASDARVEGWAHDPAEPGSPVALELLDNGVVVARFVADQFRADLAAAGMGEGYCAFSVTVQGGWAPLIPHVLQVRRAGDGAELQGSPVTVPASAGTGVTPAMRQALAAGLLAAAEGGMSADGEAALLWLVRQADAAFRARVRAGGTEGLAEMEAFYARWGRLLPDPTPPTVRVAPRRRTRPQRRTLVVCDAWAEVRQPMLWMILTGLVGLGQQVSLTTGDFLPEEGMRADFDAAGLVCLAPPFTASIEETLRRQAQLFDAVLLCSTEMTLRYAGLVRHYQKQARLVLWFGELASRRIEEQAVAEAGPELALRARTLRAREIVAAYSGDAVVAMSEIDAATLSAGAPGVPVHVPGAGIAAVLRGAFRLGGGDERTR